MPKIGFVLLTFSLLLFSLCLGQPEEKKEAVLQNTLSADQTEYCQTAADAGTCAKLEDLSMLVSPEDCCKSLGLCCGV